MKKLFSALSVGAFAASVGSCTSQIDQPVKTAASTAASTYSGRLFILDESGNCTAALQAFFPYVLSSTNFNALTQQFAGGVALSWGGIVTGNAGCSAAHNPTCSDFTDALDQQQLQCAENYANWNLNSYDEILVIQADNTTNQYGCNDSVPVNVTVPGGGTFPILGAFITGAPGPYWKSGTGSIEACGWQTGVGLHEIYEASNNGVSGDGCLGEYEPTCGPANDQRFYQLNVGGTNYDAQTLSPYNGWQCSSPLQCLQLTPTTTTNATVNVAVTTGAGTVTVTRNGTVIGSTSSSQVFNFNIGDTYAFQASPSSGYTFVQFCGDTACSIYTTSNPFSGTITASSGNVFAYFNAAGPTCPSGSDWHLAGQYCWNASGLLNGVTNHNYTCNAEGAAAIDLGACSEGCRNMGVGYNDQCWEQTSTCSTWSSWDTYACGNDSVNGNPIINYHCYYGSKVGITWCPNSCVIASGADDYCQ